MPWEEELMIRFCMIVTLALLALSGHAHGQEKKEKAKSQPVFIHVTGQVLTLKTSNDVTFFYQGAEKGAKETKTLGKEMSFAFDGEKNLHFSKFDDAEMAGQIFIFVGDGYVLITTGPDHHAVTKIGKK